MLNLKKKYLIIATAVFLVLAAAGGAGYVWYQRVSADVQSKTAITDSLLKKTVMDDITNSFKDSFKPKTAGDTVKEWDPGVMDDSLLKKFNELANTKCKDFTGTLSVKIWSGQKLAAGTYYRIEGQITGTFWTAFKRGQSCIWKSTGSVTMKLPSNYCLVSSDGSTVNCDLPAPTVPITWSLKYQKSHTRKHKEGPELCCCVTPLPTDCDVAPPSTPPPPSVK